MTGPWARFDDLRSGTSLLGVRLRRLRGRARTRPSLRVADRRPGSPPLVWFGLTGRPSPTPPLHPADPAPDSGPAAEHDELTAKAAVLTVPSATSR